MRSLSTSRLPTHPRRPILSFMAPLIICGLAALTWGAWAAGNWWSQRQSREKADASLMEKMIIDPVAALDYATDQIIDGKIQSETYKAVVRQVMISADMRVLDAAAASVSRLLAKNGNSISNNVSWFPTQVIIIRNNDNSKSVSETIAQNIPAVAGRDVIIVQHDQSFPWKESSIHCKMKDICGVTTEKIANYLNNLSDLEKFSSFIEKTMRTGPNEPQSVSDKQLVAKNVLDAKRIEIFVVAKTAAASTHRPIKNRRN